jgi:transcriptional regulator with XRE-family HTH domain
MLSLRQAQGITLYRLRTDKGHTLRYMSYKASISIGHISEVESGNKNISTESLEHYLKALDIEPVQYLQELAWTLQGKRKQETNG